MVLAQKAVAAGLRPPRLVRTRNRAPRGLNRKHHFDAFDTQHPQALAFSVGPAVHITGAKWLNMTVNSANDGFMVLFQPGSVDQVHYVEKVAGTWGTPTKESIDSTGITTTPSASSPDTMMCSRGSIRLRVVTQASNVQGLVQVLKVSTGLNIGNSTTIQDVENLVETNSRTRTYGLSELTVSHQWDCIPVSQDRYHAFLAPTDGSGLIEDPGVSTIVFMFQSPTVDQNISFRMAANYWCRYRYSGPLANAAVAPPTVPLAIVNGMRDALEAIGSQGRKVLHDAFGAAANLAAEATGSAVGGYLGNLRNQQVPFEWRPPPTRLAIPNFAAPVA